MRTAKVYMNRIMAGVLTENNDGSFIFRYDEDYLSNPNYSSISLTLPKTQQEHYSDFESHPCYKNKYRPKIAYFRNIRAPRA